MVTDSAAKPSPTSGKQSVYLDVALPVPLLQTFTYKHSDIGNVPVGARVIVPFGKRHLTGYCVAVHEELDKETGLEDSEIKELVEVVDDEPLLTKEILELTKWAAGYYSSSWGEMLKGSLPAGINALIETVFLRQETDETGSLSEIDRSVMDAVLAEGKITAKDLDRCFGSREAKSATARLVKKGYIRRGYRISNERVRPLNRKFVLPTGRLVDARNKSQQTVIECLAEHPRGLFLGELVKLAGVSVSPVKTLESLGAVKIIDRQIDRDPLAGAALPESKDHILTSYQESALEKVSKAIEQGAYRAFLIHGVTGSGKTEVYVRAMKTALAAGKTALMMVPEISLTPVFAKQLKSVFGSKVAILHSSLSSGERYDEWRRIRSGDARVVIGTRSAVFAPLQNIGLLVVDEEHDSSYRQNEMPFYNGRDTAIVRARNAGAVVILGSATPSLESYRNVETGKYEGIDLPKRVSGRPMPSAELVDMRQAELTGGDDSVLSPRLRTAIEETHSNGEQSMILLNRRGFSQFVLCRSCGESIKCRNCEITLTFHQREHRLICHYCGFNTTKPDSCPTCESRFLYFLGEGTEKIEEILGKAFPAIRIARVDRDSTRKKRQLEKVLESFGKHEIDMLVGTQMIAKGHDFPNVTLVGVISVDAGLSMPEFRSAERTFQLLTQVAGRAGRGSRAGRVLIQTFYPEHYALQHALSQDYLAFYKKEIEFRRRMNYPPFVALAQVLFKHPQFSYAFKNASVLSAAIKKSDRQNKCIVLGPAPAPLARLKGEFRIQILVKSKSRKSLKDTIEISRAEAEATGCDLKTASVEIDPINLL